MTARFRLFAVAAALAALAGCKSSGDLVVDQNVGITSVRTVCPAVGIPDYTGDVTLFRGDGRNAGDIDIIASMTNVRTQCDEADQGPKVFSTSTFDVLARRTDTHGARTIQLPYFVTVLRGGSAVISKRIGTVTLNFADGQERASATAQAGAYIDRAEATLPRDVIDKITRKRRAGQDDAAIDPLTLPDVRSALTRANFEVLVGFQLSEAQLAYNATR